MLCTCVWLVASAGCGDDSSVAEDGAKPGVTFSSPAPDELDVPLGSRIVVAFSEQVSASAVGGTCSASGSGASGGGICLVGPNGVVASTTDLAGSDGTVVEIAAPALDPGTTYAVYVDAALDPMAQNVPSGAPLFSFTTRSDRARAAPPSVVAVDGSAPSAIGTYRPFIESSTIHVVMSEPLATETVSAAPGSVELVDPTAGSDVPIRVLVDGIHITIDPIDDLTAGVTYTLKLGAGITDTGGTALAPAMFSLTPADSVGRGITKQTLRTWQPDDPGRPSRSGAPRNTIQLVHPLIGANSSMLGSATLISELGDPEALDGPIPFTIRRGSRLSASALTIALGGSIPTGLSTGNIEIELATDGGGRIYRNPYQAATQTPDNDRAPLYFDLVLDLNIYADDPEGNAVLGQTILNFQATGTVDAENGVLVIDTVGSMGLGLLGVATAPTNLVMELITDGSAQIATDTTPPTLLAAPGDNDIPQPVGAGISLVFSEPIDLDPLYAGGLQLLENGTTPIPFTLESSGAAVIVRPSARLDYSSTFQVVLSDVTDVAGNAMTAQTVMFATPVLDTTSVPLGLDQVHPGVPCALTGGNASSPGRCSSGQGNDDLYHPFTLPANEDLSATFNQPVIPSTLTHFAQCGTGSVRIEQVDDSGTCMGAVPGTFLPRAEGFGFVADQPWTVGAHYVLTIVSGGNKSCDPGEICGINGDAASFDPLAGDLDDGESGGPDVIIPFDGAPPTTSTLLIANASPFTDVNGSGIVDRDETPRDENRAALSITGTGGILGDASFDGVDCVPDLDGTQNCLYLAASMPTELGELQMGCALPDGTTADSCIPVVIFPEVVYGTSVGIDASVIIDIDTNTELSILRLREPSDGPVTGYIVDDGAGGAELIATLDLYMDAPDMDVTLSSDDLHSKPLTVPLRGPVTFLPDGRIAISLANTAAIPITVNISAPLGLSGSVDLVMPLGEMKLQLVSPLVRGGEL